MQKKIPTDDIALVRRTLIQAGVVTLVGFAAIMLWKTAEIILLIFAGSLMAIFLHSISCWINRNTGLSRKWSLATTCIVLAFLASALVWLSAPQFSQQIDELTERLPKAMDQVKQQINQQEWLKKLADQKGNLDELLSNKSSAASTAGQLFSTTFGTIGHIVLVLVLGIFLAINPGTYINGLVQLAPAEKRPRAREVLQATGESLEQWLLAKIVAMAVIGVLTTCGLWLIGIDLALILGLIAAILSFIPNIGPLLSLIPAVLIALISGPDKVVYVILLYAGVQTIESYVLTPLLQQRMVDLPPALTISMQVLMGVLAGGLGVIVATPVTAALMVMGKMWFVEDILGDKQDA